MHSVLVVDDDHDLRVALRSVFEKLGYTVYSASNGLEGLEILRRIEAPCIIILDQMLPLLDGQEFLRAKINEPTISSIPVIVVSANPDGTAGLGTSLFLEKPIDFDRLVRAVNDLCRRHKRKIGS